ncbi:MAG: thiamine pyrophosphate-dependent dehydrogenase E1 component subunit alpha [Gemmatimonadota bacterium]|nr:thiamine pyrophosphate-dependent dehydrogenase E1 component subunit alpha [Gemmatimonadota bacterium]
MSDRGITRDQLARLYRMLVLTRSLEERLERLFKQGEIVGGLYRSLGQEATAVGTASALGEGDWLAPSIRDLGAVLVRGLQPVDVLMQYTARAGGPCSGKDNTNHHTVTGKGILGPVSPLGTQLCVLNGIALSFRNRGSDRVCMTYQGEGATRTGASHEGLAFAAALRLPIVIVLEHNRWAFSNPSSRVAAVRSWSDVPKAYGIPAISVDGNDVLACRDAGVEGVARARRGDGPTVIIAETYRMLGHAQHDPQDYVPAEELETWRARDPIASYERYLLEQGLVTSDELLGIRDDVGIVLDAAVDAALADPLPAPEEARTRVYAAPEPDVTPWTRRPEVGGPGRAIVAR